MVICAIKTKRARTRHDNNIDFQPILKRASKIMPMSIVIANKGYESKATLWKPLVIMTRRSLVYGKCKRYI